MKMFLFYVITVGFIIKVQGHHSNLHHKVLNISQIVRGQNVFHSESCSVIFFG